MTKNNSAVELGRLGGIKSAKKYTKEERAEFVRRGMVERYGEDFGKVLAEKRKQAMEKPDDSQ